MGTAFWSRERFSCDSFRMIIDQLCQSWSFLLTVLDFLSFLHCSDTHGIIVISPRKTVFTLGGNTAYTVSFLRLIFILSPFQGDP